MQNHTLQDVSSKSYDRWNYMPEKRAAMKKWNAFVHAMLNSKRSKQAKDRHTPVIHSATDGERSKRTDNDQQTFEGKSPLSWRRFKSGARNHLYRTTIRLRALCPPKAEVVSSNLAGSAIRFKHLDSFSKNTV